MPSNNLNLRLRRGLKANAASSPLLNGTLNFITDTGEMFVDIDNQRVNITSVEFYNTTAEIRAITAPTNKLYVAIQDQEMYTSLDGLTFTRIIGGGGSAGAVYFGQCATAETESVKVVSVSSGQKLETPLKTGTVVNVKFSKTNSATNVKLNVNGTGAKSVYYNNAVHTTGNLAIVGGTTNGFTSYFYDGTNWVYFGHSVDNNTTYSTISADEIITGTSTVSRTVNAANLKFAIDQITGGAVNDGKLTIKVVSSAALAGTTTFTANQSGNTTATIRVPALISQLTNDEGFTNNTGTVTSVSATTGLVTNNGSPITGSGTIKANLVSETKSSLAATSMGDTANRQYAVGLDKNGKLSVNIPWENTTYGLSSTTTHGLMRQLKNDAAYFMNGKGQWAIPTGTTYPLVSTAGEGLAPKGNGSTTMFLDASGTYRAMTTATTANIGLMPKLLSNQNTKFLRADGTFAAIPNVSTANHGLAPKGNGSTTMFLDASGTYNAMTTATVNNVGLMPKLSNTATEYLNGKGVFVSIPEVTTSAAGLAPARNGSTASFLRGDGQWTTPAGTVSAMKGATASASGAPGYIGVGPSTAGYNRKFWMANGTWSEPPVMVGASSAADGSIGYVPKPSSVGYNTKYLRADAKWETIPNVSTSAPGLAPARDGSTASFLRGDNQWAAPPNMKPASSSANGSAGYVPAPSSVGYNTKYLRADGWNTIPAATTAAAGLLRTLKSTSSVDTYYLRGNGSWGAVTWDGTEAAYAALSSYDPTTIYFVHG